MNKFYTKMCAVDMTVDLEIYPNISISNLKSDIALFRAQIFAFKKRINNFDMKNKC